jgi:hypothetical protein
MIIDGGIEGILVRNWRAKLWNGICIRLDYRKEGFTTGFLAARLAVSRLHATGIGDSIIT